MKYFKLFLAGSGISLIMAFSISFLSDKSYVAGLVDELNPILANSLVHNDILAQDRILSLMTKAGIETQIIDNLHGVAARNVWKNTSCLVAYSIPISYMNQNIAEVSVCRNMQSLIVRTIKSKLFSILLTFLSVLILTFTIYPIIFYRSLLLKFINSIQMGESLPRSTDPIELKFSDIFNKYLELQIKNREMKTAYEDQKAAFLLAKQVSHDLRSPLSAANLALSKIESPHPHVMDLLKNSISRIDEIASDLLLAAPQSEKKKRTKIGAVVKKLIDEKKEFIKESAEISLSVLGNHNSFEVYGEEKEFSRILSNLLNNSIESLSSENKDKKIEIILKERDDVALLAIKDNGKGMGEVLLEELNKTDIQIISHGKEHSEWSGFGLGLYHARSYLKKIGGGFKISSQLGRGTTVEIELTKVTHNPLYQ